MSQDKGRRKAAQKLFKKPVGEWIQVDISASMHPAVIEGGMTRCFRNNRFIVMVYDNARCAHFDDRVMPKVFVQRHDNRPIPGHWREMMKIKCQLFGAQACAVEFYPPMSQLVDDANIYWMWLLYGADPHNQKEVSA